MRLQDTRKYLAFKWRRIPRIFRKLIIWSIIIACGVLFDISLIILLASLTSLNVVDWKTVVSLVMVEVLAAIIAKLLGIGEPSETEEKYQRIRLASSKTRMIPQFSHLKAIYTENEGRNPNYPYSQYFIINTKTKTCYWVPSYIDDLVEEEIIEEIKMKDKVRLQDYLKNNEIVTVLNYPTNNQLDVWST